MASPAPLITGNDGVIAAAKKAIGKAFVDGVEAVDEISITVARDSVADVLTMLRDDFAYQQLMEIAGVDYPERAERFDVCYHLLSVTKNHRLRIRVTASEDTPVPTVTGVYPSAGWLEREVFDMYGVVFAGHPDLRRILTDYGFAGHPFRKDFPLTGYVELRYSEEQKRVVYEPVQLAQDFRSFDFMSPWEGAKYVLPGDEKAGTAQGEAKGAPTPVPAAQSAGAAKPDAKAKPAAAPTPKHTDGPHATGGGKAANKEAAKPVARKARAVKAVDADKALAAAPAVKAKPKAPAKPRATKPKSGRPKGGAE